MNLVSASRIKWLMCFLTCTFFTLLNIWYQSHSVSRPRSNKKYDVIVVGAGLSGAVMAHLHANMLNKKVLIIEKRNHVGGNCYDYINDVGIRVSKYGAHLFHTKHESVWRFVQQFSSWTPYEHRVVANLDGRLVPVPVNIDTVNLLLDQDISNTKQMRKWLNKNQRHNDHPQNGEEAALSRVGKELYEQIFKPYTYKQWSKYPNELNASVLLRIPVSDSFDDRYFPNDPYQVLPTDGYTTFVKNMLTHEHITVSLNSDYFVLKASVNLTAERIIYTGPIDQYFNGSGLPKLEYRSIHFETTNLYNTGFFQPNSVVNHPKGPKKFTRIVEYKHLLAQKSPHTTIVKEFTRDTGDPYYPVPNQRNQLLYSKYRELAEKIEKTQNVHFVGRLANYKYFNMDETILNALSLFKSMHNVTLPIFHGDVEPINKKTSLTIIISHCTERLLWLQQFVSIYRQFDCRIVVYEKCNSTANILDLKRKFHDIPEVLQYNLRNVGREGHSWLQFMLSKQSLFGDLNLFMQPKPHLKIEKIMKMIKTSEAEIKHKRATENVENDVSKGHYVPFNQGGCLELEHSINPKFYPHTLDADVCCKWIRKFIKTKTCRVQLSYTGEFLVTDAGLRRTLAKYRTPFMEIYQGLSRENNPVLGHILERLWTTIFTQKGC